MSWFIDLIQKLTQQSLVVAIFLAGFFFVFWIFVRRRRSQKRYSPLTEGLLRTPGLQLEIELEKLEEKVLVGVVTAMFGPLVVLFSPTKIWLVWLVAFLVFAWGVTRCWKALNKVIQLRLACDGEQYTGAELNFLMRSGAWVFHDIPFQYGNIDHIVVSTGGVFTVETKTYRKPEGDSQSRRLSKMKFNGSSLIFPDFIKSEPIEQAEIQAKYLKQAIKKNTGLDITVIPVIALPGWFIERTARSDVWVINPKRGGPLHQAVKEQVLSSEDVERVANYVESIARSVSAGSKKMDPDAAKNFDFWNNRRFQAKKIE